MLLFGASLLSARGRVAQPPTAPPLRFVLDEGDSTLWLANASKLRCRFLPKTAQDGVHDETLKSEVLFFEEEDFEEEMRETESVIECLGVLSFLVFFFGWSRLLYRYTPCLRTGGLLESEGLHCCLISNQALW